MSEDKGTLFQYFEQEFDLILLEGQIQDIKFIISTKQENEIQALTQQLQTLKEEKARDLIKLKKATDDCEKRVNKILQQNKQLVDNRRAKIKKLTEQLSIAMETLKKGLTELQKCNGCYEGLCDVCHKDNGEQIFKQALKEMEG